MNVGRYLRGEDCHVGTARIDKANTQMQGFSSVFDGDGRIKIAPINVFPGTLPRPVTRSTARLMIAHLLRTKHSTHSLSGSTLWIVITHCLETKTDFKLNVYPGQGYFVELK